MITVTNPKVAGFTPVWAPFQGFSLLFDNPGDHLSVFHDQAELKMINCNTNHPALTFYKSLEDTLSTFKQLFSTYLFCPLPSYSYHVTLWDGLNDGNKNTIEGSARYEVEQGLFSKIPSSYGINNELVKLNQSTFKLNSPIEFQFDRLSKFSNLGISAWLKPANEKSENTLQVLKEQRRRYLDLYYEYYGIHTASLNYTPHVSLGYFANKELGELASPQMERWNEQFERNTKGKTIQFSSYSLYGFHDMATFFKHV